MKSGIIFSPYFCTEDIRSVHHAIGLICCVSKMIRSIEKQGIKVLDYEWRCKPTPDMNPRGTLGRFVFRVDGEISGRELTIQTKLIDEEIQISATFE